MPDLVPEQVRAQLAAIGLTPVDEEDLNEITHRVNAISQTVLTLEHSEADAQEPLTIFPDEEES